MAPGGLPALRVIDFEVSSAALILGGLPALRGAAAVGSILEGSWLLLLFLIPGGLPALRFTGVSAGASSVGDAS